MLHRLLVIATVVVTAILLAGCGGSGGNGDAPSVKDVTACLKDMGLKTQPSGKDDKDVVEGVFGTSDTSDGKVTNFVMALGAVAVSDKTVKEFEKSSKDFAEQDLGTKEKLKVESGSEGRYVWVVAAAEGSDQLGDARDCVKP